MFSLRVAAQIAPMLSIVLVSGCDANSSAVYRSEALDRHDHLITQDAKQKGILRQVRSTDGLVTCIEPSPDALSVFAATASGKLTTPQQLEAAFGGTRSESAANIGLRTQTITILRDQGYRICEAFANSGISDIDYTQLLRRNQILTTAVLAIEQLTGAVVGPSAAIGASASLEVDQAAVTAAAEKVAAQKTAVAKQQANVDGAKAAEDKEKIAFGEADSKASAKEKECAGLPPPPDPTRIECDKAAKTARDAATTALGKYNTAQRLTKDEQTKLQGEKDALDTLNQNLNDARDPEHKTRTASSLNGATVVSKDIPGVANAVESIVDLAFSKAYLMDLCQMYWSGTINNPRLEGICGREMELFENQAKVQADGWLAAIKRTSATLPVHTPTSTQMVVRPTQ